MKRTHFFLFIFLIAFPLASAGSVGISPAHFDEHFISGLEKTFRFNTFNSDPEAGIGIVLEGDLTQYATLSENYILGNGKFEVTLKLPENIEKPGTNTLFVKVFESKNTSEEESSGVGGIAAINAPINILVPYPGRYAESTFDIEDVNEGENSTYTLDIKNLGTEDLTIKSTIELFRNNVSGEQLLKKNLDEIFLESKNVLNIVDTLNTSQLGPGSYYVVATVDYGEKKILNQSLRVGQFLIDIIDYDYQFERGSINRFDIEIENKWNSQIRDIFATVTITDEGKVVSDFRTISTETEPWEIRNITGFFDATELESKRYLANMNLFYEDSSSNKLVAIYVQDPPKEKKYTPYIIIGSSIIGILILLGFIYLLIRIKKLNKLVRKNGKKN